MNPTLIHDVICDSDYQSYGLTNRLGRMVLSLYEPSDYDHEKQYLRVYGDHEFNFQDHYFRRCKRWRWRFIEIDAKVTVPKTAPESPTDPTD